MQQFCAVRHNLHTYERTCVWCQKGNFSSRKAYIFYAKEITTKCLHHEWDDFIYVQHSFACNRNCQTTAVGSSFWFRKHVDAFIYVHRYSTIMHVAGYMLCSLSEWKFCCFNYKVFYSSRCTYNIKSYNVHTIYASHRETTRCFILLFIHSNAPSVQHTSKWPSPWSTVTVSRTSGRLPFCYTFLFFREKQRFLFSRMCIC